MFDHGKFILEGGFVFILLHHAVVIIESTFFITYLHLIAEFMEHEALHFVEELTFSIGVGISVDSEGTIAWIGLKAELNGGVFDLLQGRYSVSFYYCRENKEMELLFFI